MTGNMKKKSRGMQSSKKQLAQTILALLLITYPGVTLFLSQFGIMSMIQSAQAESKHAEPKEEAHDEKSDSKKGGKNKKSAKKKLKVEKPDKGTFTATHKSFDEENAAQQKIDAVLILDTSRSMLRTDPNNLRTQAARLFLRFLSEGDQIGVIQFDKESKVIAPLGLITDEALPTLENTLQTLPAEGTFTDIESPVELAYQLLTEQGRPDSIRCIILLSDGKMDPYPERGTPEELTRRLFEIDVPSLRKADIKLYTLSLSAEADQVLLEKLAHEAGGSNFQALDSATIHRRFSDLFFKLKKPQTISLEKNGFMIDPSVEEATFYISKNKEVTLSETPPAVHPENPEHETPAPTEVTTPTLAPVAKEISLTSPRGESFSIINFPSSMKWYQGDQFDVITVKKPTPGQWSVSGVDTSEGFAALLTALKLQVRVPEEKLKVGEKVAIVARLTSGNKIITEEGIRSNSFYTYKVLDEDTNATISSGALHDDGLDGDIKAKDSIFSGMFQIEKSGTQRVLVGVTTPTFSRQQQFPLQISDGSLKLELIPADSFSNTPDLFRVVLNEAQWNTKNFTLSLMTSAVGSKEEKIHEMLKNSDSENIYEFPTTKLLDGKLKVYAKYSAKKGAKKDPVVERSDTIEYVSNNPEMKIDDSETAHGSSEEEGTSEHEDPHATPRDPNMVWGGLSIGLSILWAALVSFFVLKKVDIGKGLPDQDLQYVRSPELESQLKSYKSQIRKERRVPNDSDRILFALLGDIYEVETPAEEAVSE
jgi:uncharacterized protein (TIGR03503 family)